MFNNQKMYNVKKGFLAFLLLLITLHVSAQSKTKTSVGLRKATTARTNIITPARTMESFNHNWRFILDSVSDYSAPDVDDASWRKLNLPHDWSIEGEFSEEHPATAGGGALPGGFRLVS